MFIETDRGHTNLAHVVRMVADGGRMTLYGIGGVLGTADVTRAARRAAGFIANRAQTEFFNPAHIAYSVREPAHRGAPRSVTKLYGARGEPLGWITDPIDFERLPDAPADLPDAA